jgi:nucleoside 2-deoxyribosyltransferase
MKVLYIAGPLRAWDDWAREHNCRRAEAVALEVWMLGIAALCPHTMTRFYSGTMPDANFMAGALEMMTRCDGVLVLEHWQSSQGTRLEVQYAKEKGIPVFESLAEVERAWCGNSKPTALQH